jgi:hypothetical protein
MPAATALRVLVATSPLVFVACRPPAGAAPAQTPAVSLAAAPAAPAGPAPLSPLRDEEKALAARLSATVSHLAGDIGERNSGRSWNLASATDDLAVTLEQVGFSVRRQGVRAGDDVVQNLEVRVPGGQKGREVVVVGAHFDSAPGSPGADADASGVAAVVELARAFRQAKPGRSLCFTLFVNGEAPHYGTDGMGALTYAKDLVSSGLEVKGMVALDGIGAYSTADKSQTTPPGFATALPERADFIALLASARSRGFADAFFPAIEKNATLPVFRGTLPDGAASLPGDHWAFEAVGLQAVLVTDTGSARSADSRQKTDQPAALDFDRMARVVTALEVALREFAG